MHSNVVACAVWGAPSGSSVATAVTVGTVAIGEIKKHKYNEPLFLGTIAAGGTLGILIPPSINFILYGLLTNSSVPRLYLAGFLPGFMLAGFFMVIVLFACLIDRKKGGTPIETTWANRIRVLPSLIPPLFIFMVVVGSIYAGVATPTEAASLGVVAALILAAWERRVSLSMVLIVAFYLILGCFMETISMMILTTPFIAPIVFALGWDPIWWGIVLTILIEAALITPPVGLNLYVVQGMRGRGSINEVIRGSLPFVFAMLVLIALLMVYPDVALWLPRYVMG